MLSRFTILAMLAAAMTGEAIAQSGAALQSGDVAITLAAGAGKAEGFGPLDMRLDFACRDGQWTKDVWGYATWFNRGHHYGQTTKAETAGPTIRIAVKMTIADDAAVPGGEANYELELKRDGNQFAGTFTGMFLGAAVSGNAAGAISESPVKTAANFTPPQPGEHPRLIFRKSDLPTLKKRMETPEGKAIVEMMVSRSPVRQLSQVGDRRASWLAANFGVIYQLNGDKEAPRYAQQCLMEVVRHPAGHESTDVQLGPRLLGMALAYDLCCDAWDADFRAMITTYMRQAMNDLYRGTIEALAMEGVAPDPWNYRNAVRMSAVGCAAMALAGEKDGKETITEAAHIMQVAEREVIAYLKMGVTAGGAAIEGDFARNYVLSNGLLQFLHASRVARGRDLSNVNRNLLAGYVLTAPPELKNGIPDYGISSISVQISGRWPMGLGSVPADLLPAMKWCFDHNVGLEGKKHFDLAYPYHAAYALANYPFEGVAAKAPGEALPAFFADRDNGQFIFRSEWKEKSDFVTVMSLQSQTIKGMDLQQAPGAGDLRIWGLGQEWIAGQVGAARENKFLGAKTLAYETPRPRQAVMCVELDRLFMTDMAGRTPPRRTEKDPDVPYLVNRLYERPSALPKIDPEILKMPGVMTFPYAPSAYRESKIKGKRHFAVDYSGASGAPALFVIIDRFEGGNPRWDLGLKQPPTSATAPAPKKGAPPTNVISMGESDGANLSGMMICRLGTAVRGAKPSDAAFVVFTIQNGTAPQIKVDGAGLDAKVTVGQQTITFDGTKIVLGK